MSTETAAFIFMVFSVILVLVATVGTDKKSHDVTTKNKSKNQASSK